MSIIRSGLRLLGYDRVIAARFLRLGGTFSSATRVPCFSEYMFNLTKTHVQNKHIVSVCVSRLNYDAHSRLFA